MFRSRVYPIVDVDGAAAYGWAAADLARALLDGGADVLQIRAKHLSGGATIVISDEVVSEARRRAARVIINDRADVALVAGADGVHLGQDDLAPPAVRRMLGARALIGWSTHTRDQLDAALGWPIDYVAVGPVFETSTKRTGYEAVGLDLVRYARDRFGDRPVVAIGGITLATAASVVAAGATAVAVISDLLVTASPSDRMRAFLDAVPM